MKKVGLLLALLSMLLCGKVSAQERVVNIVEKASNGDLAGVQEYIAAGVDINTQVEHGYTALMGAVNGFHVEVVKYLVENGADINIKNEYDMSALDSYYFLEINYNGDQDMWDSIAASDAINKPKNREILIYLIENGADASVKNSSNSPILIWAAKENELEIVKALVEKKQILI